MSNYTKWTLGRWIVLAASVLAFVSILHQVDVRQQSKPKHVYADMRHAQEDLQFMYGDFNEEFFANHLPKNTKIIFETPIPSGAKGETQKVGGNYIIFIDSYYDRDMGAATDTLFHEMCHVEVPWEAADGLDGHGPQFQGCMHRLANEGAFEDIW